MTQRSSVTPCLFVQATPLRVHTFMHHRTVCDTLTNSPRPQRQKLPPRETPLPARLPPPASPFPRRSYSGVVRMVTSSAESLNLPPALQNYVERFATVPDAKLRYQQLLFLAKELPVMEEALKTDDNRVYGCTSLVHVHVSLSAEGRVVLQGDSDSQLTKGLLALLVNGLREAYPEDVAKVDPAFITFSGLAASLTPSRNNGFVSMLEKIKQQVADLSQGVESGADEGEDEGGDIEEEFEGDGNISEDEQRPVYSAILRKLRVLKPVALDVVDDSAAHAGHAKDIGLNGESHFSVLVIAEAFDGLSVVQRHRLVYTLLKEEMSNGWIHALQIDARTPAEVEN